MQIYTVLFDKKYLVLFLCLSASQVFSQTSRQSLVWPPPPDIARIQHVQTISTLDDLEIKKGFFSKLFGFIFGAHESRTWLVQPVGITVSNDGIIFVADPGAKGVHVIDQKNKHYDFIFETPFGHLESPVGVAVTQDGKLYVTDSQRKEIIEFDDDLDAEAIIKGQYSRPTGITINSDRLYVVDTEEHNIIAMDLKGNFISAIGKRGNSETEFNYPVSLAVNNSLYIVDALNYRIQHLDFRGKFLASLGRQGTSTGSFASPKSIALDSDGNIYVTDALMDNFQIFSPQGQLLLVVGRKGNRDGEFMSPSGIAIDENDRIYVVDTLNKRIQIFQYLK
jgi:DNA-binding beta-propeller fold protein YncE